MRITSGAIWLLAFLVTLVSCSTADPVGTGPAGPEIQAVEISDTDLPPEFDPTRTYRIVRESVIDPERLLTELWNSRIEATRAWQPLDDRCFDPIGPRFTVELLAEDQRMLDFGFEPGVGRLGCASRLIEFRVTN